MKRSTARLNALLPGAGLWQLGRRRLGALLLAGWLGPGVLLAVAALSYWPTWISAGLGAAMGADWAAGQLALARLWGRRHNLSERKRVAELRADAERFYDQGKAFEALLAVDQWLELEPDNVHAHRLQARVYLADGKYFRARQAYEQVARLDEQALYRHETAAAMERLGGAEKG